MNRLHCPRCGRDWYSASADTTEPCKCGGQLQDMGPAGVIDRTAERRAAIANACLICGWLLIVGLLFGTLILLMRGAKW